ncbi:hypothetical protein PSTEL_00505 [Paenibacillus stellifer]|uniref:Uncharacterized protein n=1 Tax=Paenibacillus stellifer TaxID=169760 RepID=A0A089LLR8_9BACL|nr:hypothetical protein [Paenibacillus stellifer]AIQ61837.1 hypothetical protein PSTEL_00505 [Paenibacillus stellifer]
MSEMEQTIEKLKGLARDSWSGEEGERRAERLEKYLRAKLIEYSEALNTPQEEILRAWEKKRDYSAINYYQECNQPSIQPGKVRVFESVGDMLQAIGEKKFRCPACGGISTDPYQCDSGKKVKKKTCDWKVYGFLGDLGKGIHVFCKDKMRGETIFMPVSWESSSVTVES